MDLAERQGTVVRRHPWEVARAEFFLRLLDEKLQLLGPAAASSWLDVGGGDGWFAECMRAAAGPGPRIVCWDINYTDESPIAGEVGVEFTSGRPSGRFDVILMLDVIEHVADDSEFVADIVDSFLAEGGRLLVSVPAYMALFTSHDTFLQHYRRYSPRQGRRLLRGAGLEIEAEGGLFHSLLLARVGQTVVERARGPRPVSAGVGDWRHGSLVSAPLTRALHLDASASLALGSRGVVLPGLSYWAVCRKSA